MKEWFWDRIYGEYQAYRASVLSYSKAEIFDKCYEIHTMVNLYEILKDNAEGLSDEIMAALLKRRHILWELFETWLKQEDSSYVELESCVLEEIKKVSLEQRKEKE